MEIKVLEHYDVRGKKLYYLVFKTKSKEYMINVGEKTYNEVKVS